MLSLASYYDCIFLCVFFSLSLNACTCHMPPVSMALACLHFFVALFHPASPTACVFVSFVVVPHTHTHTHTSCHCHWLSVEALLYETVDTDEDEDADKDADVPCWSCCCLSWFFFSLFFCCLFFFCLAIVAVAYIDIVVKSFKVFIFFSLSPFSQHFAVLSLFCRFHFLFL